jgi:DNA-binding response OmpR family regulator
MDAPWGAWYIRLGLVGHRIIIAEDDPEIVLLMQKLLASYELEVFGDGLQALKRLGQDPLPDLLILDVMMPHLDGVTLLKSLKGHPRTKKIPAIIVSAKGGPKDVIDGISAGVRHYLVKPFKADDLLRKVKKILG